MQRYELVLWTDEMVFTRGALEMCIDQYSKAWRETFIKYDAHIAQVYLPAIQACRSTIAAIDTHMPPK